MYRRACTLFRLRLQRGRNHPVEKVARSSVATDGAFATASSFINASLPRVRPSVEGQKVRARRATPSGLRRKTATRLPLTLKAASVDATDVHRTAGALSSEPLQFPQGRCPAVQHLRRSYTHVRLQSAYYAHFVTRTLLYTSNTDRTSCRALLHLMMTYGPTAYIL